MQPQSRQSASHSNNHLQGAALIDASGKEIPITEEMIRRACEDLDQRWQYPAKRLRPAR
jgi:hypothetical protein